MKGVILVPWRAPDDRRALLWDWTRYFLEDLGWPIFTGDDGGKPFSRAASMNAAAQVAGDWDVALLGDADTVQDKDGLEIASEQASGTGGVVVPWTRRMKLSRAGTMRFAQGHPVTDADLDRTDRTSPNGGGATVVVSRAAWDAVGGFDERLRGYGNEDLCFQMAVETLVLGMGWPRVEGTVWHLWHQPAKNVGTMRAATPANQRWLQRYTAARWKTDAMRAILEERDAHR